MARGGKTARAGRRAEPDESGAAIPVIDGAGPNMRLARRFSTMRGRRPAERASSISSE